MLIRTLRDSESLESYSEELLFTEARLKSDEQAKEFVALITELLAKVDVVRADQVGAWREEIAAQAAVSAADDHLDDWIRRFDRALKEVVNGNVQAPAYRRYLSSAPWTFIRLGLENEISRVRGWIDSLASEPEPTLKTFAVSLAKVIAIGEAALEQRRKAVSSRSDHRARSIASLVEEINATRAALYGSLAKKALASNLPSDWPSRFFRRSSRGKDDQPTPTPAPTTVAKPAVPTAT